MSTDSFSPVQSIGDQRTHRYIKLASNGMPVVLISDPTTDFAAASLCVGVGSASDPRPFDGLAHFLEHMLFLGTAKYPNESEFHTFLSSNAGNSNAWTSYFQTNYHFQVSPSAFDGALDRFAQFFISPLFQTDMTNREIEAVNNEHAKNIRTDEWRKIHMARKLSGNKIYGTFGTGNRDTLRRDGIREQLLAFHDKYYSASLMTLAVLGKESLDELEKMAIQHFSGVPNRGGSVPRFAELHPAQLLKDRPLPPQHFFAVQAVKDIHSLSLLFATPPAWRHYIVKPLHVLSNLIGHEGRGSILAELKRAGFASELSSGPYEESEDMSIFSIKITLTPAGLLQFPSVIALVYSYMELIRSIDTPTLQRLFTEESAISQINFNFKSKESPFNYVTHLTSALHQYDPKHVLTGAYLMEQFDGPLIREFLDWLKPQNCLVLLQSQHLPFGPQFTGAKPPAASASGVDTASTVLDSSILNNFSSIEVEQYYGLEYFSGQFTDSVWKTFTEPALNPRFAVPPPNPFISSDFELKHKAADGAPRDQLTGPLVVDSSAAGTVWFKGDAWFLKPKANVMCKLVIPAAYFSPRSSVLTLIVSKLLDEQLNEEFAYEASLAGLNYQLQSTSVGLQLTFTGYNHKLPELIRSVMDKLRTFPLLTDSFTLIKDKLTRKLKNFAFEQPYEHAMTNEQTSLLIGLWQNREKLEAIQTIQLEEVEQFKQSLFDSMQLEVLVHGNLIESEAKQIGSLIAESLKFTPFFPSQYPELRAVILEPRHAYIHAQTVLNPDEENSSVITSFQLGLETPAISAINQIWNEFTEHRVYNRLRTEEQLGYLTWSGTASHRGVAHWRVILQSSEHSAIFLEQRIEEFLESIGSTVEALTESELESLKTTALTKLNEADKSLTQETNRHWGEINSRRRQFDRVERESNQIKAVSLEQFKQVYYDCFRFGGSQRRKISLRVFGKAHQVENRLVRPEKAEENRVETAVIIEDFHQFKAARQAWPAIGWGHGQ